MNRQDPNFWLSLRSPIHFKWCLLAVFCLACTASKPKEKEIKQSPNQPPPDAPTVIRFDDASGLLGTGPVRGYGVALTDYNLDGWPDVTIAHESGVLLLRNSGKGDFIPDNPRAQLNMDLTSAHTVVWVDYDDDGDLDLFVGRLELEYTGIDQQKITSRLLRNK